MLSEARWCIVRLAGSPFCPGQGLRGRPDSEQMLRKASSGRGQHLHNLERKSPREASHCVLVPMMSVASAPRFPSDDSLSRQSVDFPPVGISGCKDNVGIFSQPRARKIRGRRAGENSIE